MGGQALGLRGRWRRWRFSLRPQGVRMDLSSHASATASPGLIIEPPLSSGASPPSPLSRERRNRRRPRGSGRPIGLMTPDQVDTTLREEAETGRSFEELAVEHGVDAEDLAKLTGIDPEPAAEAVAEPAPEIASEPEPPSSDATAEPE